MNNRNPWILTFTLVCMLNSVNCVNRNCLAEQHEAGRNPNSFAQQSDLFNRMVVIRQYLNSGEFLIARTLLEELMVEHADDRTLIMIDAELSKKMGELSREFVCLEKLLGNTSDKQILTTNCATWYCRYGEVLEQRGFDHRANMAYLKAIQVGPAKLTLQKSMAGQSEIGDNLLKSLAFASAAEQEYFGTRSTGQWEIWLSKSICADSRNKYALAFKAFTLASKAEIPEAKELLRQIGPFESLSPRARGWANSALEITSLYGKRTVVKGPNTGINIPGYHRP